MGRSLTAGVATELEKRVKRVEILVELEYDTITFRAWSGVIDRTFFGNTYQGVGDLGEMGDIRESTELRGARAEFGLNGASPALVSLALNDARFGKSAKAWVGLFDANDNLIDGDAGLIDIYDGDMEVPVVEKRPDTALITQRAVSDFEAVRNTIVRRFTDQDQKIDFTADVGLEFIATLRDASFTIKTG